MSKLVNVNCLVLYHTHKYTTTVKYLFWNQLSIEHKSTNIYCWLSRNNTARGSCTGLVTVGTTKKKYAYSLINKTDIWVGGQMDWWWWVNWWVDETWYTVLTLTIQKYYDEGWDHQLFILIFYNIVFCCLHDIALFVGFNLLLAWLAFAHLM